MRIMDIKRVLFSAAMVLMMAGTAATQASSYREEMIKFLDSAAVSVEKSLKANDLAAMDTLRARMKDIGLSYDQSIALPTDTRLVAGRSRDQQAILWGMYMVDMAYALTYDRRVDTLFPVIRALEESLGFRSASITEGMRVNDSTIQFSRGIAFWYDLTRKSKSDSYLAQILVCGFYGSSLEAFHLLARQGLSTGITADFVALVSDTMARLVMTQDILAAYAGTPENMKHNEFVRVLDTAGKGKVIESLVGILQGAKGKPNAADLRAILAVIAKVRDPLLKPVL